LINISAPTVTAALRFTTVAGLGGLADLRTPANGRLEVLKVSRDTHTDEEGVAAFKQVIAEIHGIEPTWWEFLVRIPEKIPILKATPRLRYGSTDGVSAAR
jgi:hypothetical protein